MLRDGGNAVDAAIAAMLTSWVAEPLLNGPGAGGYMLVAGADEEPLLLDFFVAAPGTGAPADDHAELVPIEVSFGDATQTFNVGAASCGAYGTRWASPPPHGAGAPWRSPSSPPRGGAGARGGDAQRRAGLRRADPRRASSSARRRSPPCTPRGVVCCRGRDCWCCPELGDTIERLGAEGAQPFYTGDLAEAVVAWTVGRRRAHRRGPARLRRRATRTRPRLLSRARGAHQPAPVGRRHAARAGAGAAGRAARSSPRWATSSRSWRTRRPSARRRSSTA